MPPDLSLTYKVDASRKVLRMCLFTPRHACAGIPHVACCFSRYKASSGIARAALAWVASGMVLGTQDGAILCGRTRPYTLVALPHQESQGSHSSSSANNLAIMVGIRVFAVSRYGSEGLRRRETHRYVIC